MCTSASTAEIQLPNVRQLRMLRREHQRYASFRSQVTKNLPKGAIAELFATAMLELATSEDEHMPGEFSVSLDAQNMGSNPVISQEIADTFLLRKNGFFTYEDFLGLLEQGKGKLWDDLNECLNLLNNTGCVVDRFLVERKEHHLTKESWVYPVTIFVKLDLSEPHDN